MYQRPRPNPWANYVSIAFRLIVVLAAILIGGLLLGYWFWHDFIPGL